VIICLERGADLHMAQLMPQPLTVSCFSKIQIGFAFLVLDHPGSRRKRAVKQVKLVFPVVLNGLSIRKCAENHNKWHNKISFLNCNRHLDNFKQ